MSGSGTIYTEQSMLGHTLGFSPMAFPAQVFVGLCSAAMPPSETVQGVEAFGNGYARQQAQFALIATPANIAANVATVEYPLASGGWGTLGFFELWDAPAGGNRLYWGALIDTASQLPTTITVGSGDIVRFSAGTLAVQASTGAGGTGSVGAYLPLAGGTLTGPLLLAADPTTYLQAATKQYVDAHSGTAGGPGFLPLSGGTMLGPLALAGNATAPLQAVPLQQVDTLNVVNVLNHGAKGDGTTDDTAAIQGAINTYAGKATVFIPWTSASFRTGQLTIPSNTDLLINGTLFALPGLPSGYLTTTTAGTSNIVIRGYGIVDANGAAQAAVGGMAGLALSNTSNVRVSGITLRNAYHWNFNITQSNNVVLNGITVNNTQTPARGNAPEFAAECSDCWLMNSLIDGTNAHDYGFSFYGGVTNSGAIGNVVRYAGGGTSAPGIGILSDGPSGSNTGLPCKNIIIADNIVYGCGSSGISSIYVTTGDSGFQSGIIIANNRCYNNNLASGGSVVADIYIDESSDVTITGNQISANGSATHTGLAGIFLGPNARHLSITGNQIYNVGQGSTNGAGLWNNGAQYVFFSGNYIYDNQTTPTMQYSMIGGAGTHNAYIGNFFDRPYNMGSAADTVFANSMNGIWTVGSLTPGADSNSVIGAHSGQSAKLQYQSQYIARWLAGTDGATESGSNTGSNYVITSCADNGTPNTPPSLSINRATSTVTMQKCNINGNTPTYTLQGGYIMWNRAGNGMTNFVNNHGLGTGGFNFADTDGTTDTQVLLLTKLVAQFNVPMQFSPLPANAANDAAAATAGVPVGGVYRNASALMVRTV